MNDSTTGMTMQQAREAAEKFLAGRYEGSEMHVVIDDSFSREESFGWVFFPETAAYLESEWPEDALIGQGPLAVDSNGRVHELPTHTPTSEYVELVHAGMLPWPTWWRERGDKRVEENLT
ncbi:MAG: hypothetical protein NVSMB52_12700 [Chloroflexota bacterium]